MNIALRNGILLVLIIAIIGGFLHYYSGQVSEKTEVVNKDTIKKDVVTVTKEIVKPDGTKETTTVTTDTSTEKKSEKDITTSAAKSQWLVAVGVNRTIDTPDLIYNLHVQRRILGPLFVGANVDTRKTVGVSIGMEF